MKSARKLFADHATQLLQSPFYKNWRPVAKSGAGYGIFSIAKQARTRFNIEQHPDNVHIITIKPSATYNNDPPIVISDPPISDPCWDSAGVLHWTRWANGVTPWDHFRNSSNPLIYIIEELQKKYKLSV